MPTTIPSLPPPSRRNLERTLRELRTWRDRARDDYHRRAPGAGQDELRTMRQLVDDLEWLCYRLEQVLHPAGPETKGGDQ